jgi:LytS/YehU family sensor histidine kinase
MRGPRGRWRPFNIRSIIDIIVYGGVVSLTHAVAILRRSRQRERRALELEAGLARARLDALRLQINPHFLFNALNAIASLIHSRPEAADEMIGSLSELLRASLHSGGSHEVTLSGEMEMLRLFTDIERARFGERIRFEEDLAPETLPAMVPSLILQPLVENAIRHGLEPRVEAGTVIVRARRNSGRLLLTVSDNGAGYAPGPDAAEHEGPGGIGLSNTRDRLRALYGADQTFTIAPGESGGTTITLDIPWHTA